MFPLAINKPLYPPPQYCLAGTTTGKIFRRTIAGSFSLVYTHTSAVRRFAKNYATKVVAITAGVNLISNDSGATWTTASPGFTGGMCVVYSYNDKKWYAGSLTDGVYQSSDGVTWTKMGTLTTRVNDMWIAKNGTLIIATATAGCQYWNGTTWTQYASLGNSGQLFVFGGSNLYYVGASAAYQSSNNGATWSAGSGVPANDPRSCGYTSSKWYAGYGANGIFTSINNGTSWTQVLASAYVYCMDSYGDILIAGSLATTNGFLITTNGGTPAWSNTGLTDLVLNSVALV